MTHEYLSTDVVIVGGGPAGSAAAIELSRSGRSVILLDKATFPRDKCCGDGLTTLALRELEQLGFDPVAVDDWFDVSGAVLRSPSGRQITVPLPDDGRYAAVAPRLQLDDALLRLAGSHGADIRDGHGFRTLDTSRSESRRPCACRSRRADHRHALRDRSRRDVEPGAQGHRRERPGLPRRVARLSPVRLECHRIRRPRTPCLVRARPGARVRLVVSAAGQPRQHRVRRAP